MVPRVTKLRCPICKAPVKDSDPEFPFCSTRCRTIDLGRWASGHYVVSSPLRDTEDLSPQEQKDSEPDEE